MRRLPFARRSLVAILTLLASAGTLAGRQQAVKTYQPEVGQPGKDVVWVPTCQPLVEAMLDLARVERGDYVVDLGSGDGRTVIAAARRGARALGIEYNPDMIRLSAENAAKAGVTAQARFVSADLFESDFSQATVVTMFLLPSINLKLRPRLLAMEPGTRVVSNTFTMDDWVADETVSLDDGACTNWRTALLWIVPARVEGTWQLPGGRLMLAQHFQTISGTLSLNGTAAQPVVRGRLRGTHVEFGVGTARYEGVVRGDIIEGTVTADGATQPWTATRGSR